MSKRRRRPHHRPPWWDEKEWDWQDRERLHERMKQLRASRSGAGDDWHADRRRLFFRFALIFGLLVLLGCGILAALAATFLFPFYVVPSGQPQPELRIFPYGLVPLIVVLIVALRRVGLIASRRLTTPLSDMMRAADALATGDLSARVPEQRSGEFGHFARSFNDMAEALQQADRQRRELLADVAHELRTPLTVIQGNLEALRDGVYEATPEHLDLVLDESQRLARLVDDLRLLTLAEAGQLPLDFQTIDVPQLLSDLAEAFQVQAADAGITLQVQAPGPLPRLLADPQRLAQVLGNLITNALRYTPAGGQVTLGAEPVAGARDLRLWVSDTGEGIPPEDLPRIFDRFWRGDPARSRQKGAGSGLGLAIAKSLVEAHGGDIHAESRPGQGTTLSCILPVPPPEGTGQGGTR